MLNIQGYLGKFSKRLNDLTHQKTQIVGIIEKYTQIIVLPEEIEMKDYVIYLKSSSAVSNKVFIYKNRILEEISMLLPDLKIFDIK